MKLADRGAQSAERYLERRGFRWLDKAANGSGGLWRVVKDNGDGTVNVDRVDRFPSVMEAAAFVARQQKGLSYRTGRRVGFALAIIGVLLVAVLITRIAVYIMQTLT